MKIETFSSGSPEETSKIAYDMAMNSKPGDIICLSGDLGVGKTVFTKGFAKGLGIDEPVVSPTFTIVQVYESGRMPLYHFDVYRIDDIDEMDEIGYEDCFFGQGVSLVEWADKIEDLLPETCTRVTISKDLQKGFDYRSIEIRKA
ncbi:MAG: tRNA (adenosine(37)-N6)-threonylcarbamoyltransferase complex ATPase subunit type 1 TsaE [Lachnospiraceae bacterium]|nr:tRNA (adenosine(37)-N6)-threonylcarbamoyltransferase complex ATPase subunit type 1 TsaE [Lachnospiraceae bacterium]